MSLKLYKGYIFSREINGQVIPQGVQNLVIRSYAKKKKLDFFLSATEYYMDHCYMILNARLEELDELSGFIFYSIHLLPKDTTQRQEVYAMILGNEGHLHFALEELVISKSDNIQTVEDIILCKNLIQSTQLDLLDKEYSTING